MCTGIKSEARKVVLGGQDQPPLRAGFAAYRAIIDTEKMKSDPDVSWLLDNQGQNLWYVQPELHGRVVEHFIDTLTRGNRIGDQRHVMTYAIAGGKFFNLVLSHPEDSDPSTWQQETAIQEMKQHFRDWDPRLTKLIDMIKQTLKWPLLTGKPLRNWVSSSGKLVIIGDAAHPMVPYMSEGAAMAVEDGASLAEMLSLVTAPDQLRNAMSVFEQVRILRTGQMQEASLVNGKLWHFADGRKQRDRDEAMKAEVVGGVVEESPNQWSDPVTQRWVYGYDAERVVAEAWENYLCVSSKL